MGGFPSGCPAAAGASGEPSAAAVTAASCGALATTVPAAGVIAGVLVCAGAEFAGRTESIRRSPASRSRSRRCVSNVPRISVVARRNSAISLPIFLASSGSFSGPNITSAITKMTIKWGMLNIPLPACPAVASAKLKRPALLPYFGIIEEALRGVKPARQRPERRSLGKLAANSHDKRETLRQITPT